MLEVTNLSVSYGRTPMLRDVSLSVNEGELVCVMGRNGVGKTTLMNAVMGVLPAQSGKVVFTGRDITKKTSYARARAGLCYVPQGHTVFPQLTVWENLQVVQESRRGLKRALIDDALDAFPRLKEMLDRKAGFLSGGQQQQLAIARALVQEPKLLVLDEPTEGIQPSIIIEIEDAIRELHKSRGLSILLVEQYVDFALRLADRYAVMEHGQIVETGDTLDFEAEAFAELLTV